MRKQVLSILEKKKKIPTDLAKISFNLLDELGESRLKMRSTLGNEIVIPQKLESRNQKRKVQKRLQGRDHEPGPFYGP